MPDWVEQVGALHLHSRYSDGAGVVEDMVRWGRRARLDFLVLSDHDTLAAMREGWQGRHGCLTVLIGAEITSRHRGHLVAMRVRHCEGYAVAPTAGMLDAISAQGGYGIVAHPMGKHKPSMRIRHLPWHDWNHPAIRGLEIWAYMHDWISGVAWYRLPEAYQFWRYPERCVEGPNRNALRLWDRLGRKRRLSGVAGLDCHGRRVPLAGIEIFPYERMFRYVRNHFFVDRERVAREPEAAFWEALAEGRGFIAHDIIADARGTRCRASLPSGRELQMGEETRFENGTTVEFRIPQPAQVLWVVNGRVRLREETRTLRVRPCGPGVYRFEAWLKGRPWIFTNPFYLR